MLDNGPDFVNYYELLGLTEDASTTDIEEALDIYQESMTAQLNNPLTMSGARYAINSIIPGIHEHLLSGQANRTHHDQQLAAFKLRQVQAGEHEELPDDQGLDTPNRQPFFFDLYDGYDTETPAYTLRDIARRLDQEWEHARTWIVDASAATHPLVGYLTHAALRRRLAERAAQITKAISPKGGSGMSVNEAIERCIMLLSPDVERPGVYVQGFEHEGNTFLAGTFFPDHPGKSELTLCHAGQRGCTFGVIESKTPWLTLQWGRPAMRFALMPQSANPRIGPSQVNVPLNFDLSSLAHAANHTAELVIRMENFDTPAELLIHVLVYVPALPPRVVFEPPASAPIAVAATQRGTPVQVIVVPRNIGDEALIPLVARMFTENPAATVRPEYFHANEPITLTIDTRIHPHGSRFDIMFSIDYSPTPGAQGLAALHVQGEILPTIWQSMLRTRVFGKRFITGLGGIIIGSILLGTMGASLAGHIATAWLLLLAIPLLLLATMHVGTDTMVIHIQQSGRLNMQKRHISPYMLWGIPLGVGIVLALLCGLITNSGTSFTISAVAGALIGGAAGFIIDSISRQTTRQKSNKQAKG